LIILRVDVDMPYKYPFYFSNLEKTMFKKNGKICSAFRTFAYLLLDYYRNLVEFTKFLKDFGVKATFFLPDFYLPPKCIRKHLSCHDLGIHVSTGDLESILRTKREMSSLFGREIDKFSAHDYSVFAPYEVRFLQLLRSSEFKIFSGNHPPRTLEIKRIGDSFYFPEIFYTRESPVIFTHDFKKYDMEWLLKKERDNAIVVCTHPVELSKILDGTKNTAKKLETIFKQCHITSFEGWLNEQLS